MYEERFNTGILKTDGVEGRQALPGDYDSGAAETAGKKSGRRAGSEAQSGTPARLESTHASVSSRLVFFVGIATALFAAGLTIRTYMPCPFWDEWAFISQIAKGASPSSLKWLWSQHNEHRLVMTRLLVWLDYAAFGAKNISLFVEIYLVQLSEWALLACAIEHATIFSASLKRTLQGLFAFYLFHPNQAENLTWAFQISFVLCFAIGTAALLSVTFLEALPPRYRSAVAVFVFVAPLIAGMNLSGGLFIGPVVIALAYWKRVSRRLILSWTIAYLVTFIVYLTGYHTPEQSSPIMALSHPVGLIFYLVSYFDASWQIVIPIHSHIPAFCSIIFLAALTAQLIRSSGRRNSFEVFCIAECLLILITASATAVGRYHLGVEQAGSSRYQTPAMLYWACLAALAVVRWWRKGLSNIVLSAMLAASLFFPAYWMAWGARREPARRVCSGLWSNNFEGAASGILYPQGHSDVIRSGSALLRHKWSQ